MTTRAYVPNVDGEGSIGTTDKKWGAMYVASPDSTASDNRVATTAWVQSICAEIYKKAKLDAHPVGSYYWSNDSTNPATLFGGTWEALPAGYTLIAQGSGSDSFGSFTYTAGQKYGERKHPLTTDELPGHSHTASVSSAGNHYHLITRNIDLAGTAPNGVRDSWDTVNDFDGSHTYKTSEAGAHTHTVTIGNTGGGQPHNNFPPSIACYGWRRTA